MKQLLELYDKAGESVAIAIVAISALRWLVSHF
jgi:hypothetical protein